MKQRYHIVYKSKIDNDCCTVWTDAVSKQDAMEQVFHDYWDVKEIIDVY